MEASAARSSGAVQPKTELDAADHDENDHGSWDENDDHDHGLVQPRTEPDAHATSSSASARPIPPWRVQRPELKPDLPPAPKLVPTPPKHPPPSRVPPPPPPPPPPARRTLPDGASELNMVVPGPSQAQGKKGTRRPRPRGGQGANRFWHSALAGAIKQGPAVEWLFRVNFPKPGEEDVHQGWLTWIREEFVSPSQAEFDDDTYQMLLPTPWRRNEYKNVTTMEEFVEARNRQEAKRARRW